MSTLRPITIWVWLCAGLNGAGWLLSAAHQLNAAGYLLMLAAGAIATVWAAKTARRPAGGSRKWSRRFQKPFPLMFLFLAFLAFLGGVLYPPSNYDGLAYRLPRILHWLDAGQWHWIHTIFARVNTRACGMEWTSAPWIAIFHTDRFLFLINTISFLFLPGLVFSVFTRLGVRRRVAWYWMWLMPTGYGFLLQAGSIGNDLFAVPFVLAAMDFALRARVSKSPGDFFTAIVAAGMLTACKLSNLTLLLPWTLAMLPSIRLAWRWPVRMTGVCALALVASVLPTAVENWRHVGDWTGMAAEQPNMVKAPVFKTVVNVGQAAVQNLVPPVFPLADRWDRLMDHKLPDALITRLDRTMEAQKCRFYVEQMQIEENAGLGFGLSVLLLASLVAALLGARGSTSGSSWWMTCVRWSPFISLLALIAQSNLYPVARLLTPYYPLLVAPFLAIRGHDRVVKQGWWRMMALAVFGLAVIPLVVSPARPLFPVQTLLNRMHHAPERVKAVYTVYRERNDAFAPVRALLPADETVLGLTTFDDPETSLWRPFGSRRIVHVCPDDQPADLERQKVRYVLVKAGMFGPWFPGSFEEWVKKMNLEVVQKISLNLRAADGPEDWYLVKRAN